MACSSQGTCIVHCTYLEAGLPSTRTSFRRFRKSAARKRRSNTRSFRANTQVENRANSTSRCTEPTNPQALPGRKRPPTNLQVSCATTTHSDSLDTPVGRERIEGHGRRCTNKASAPRQNLLTNPLLAIYNRAGRVGPLISRSASSVGERRRWIHGPTAHGTNSTRREARSPPEAQITRAA